MANNGRQGESLFSRIMAERGYSVNNVSKTPEYWEQDIDFIITSPTTGLVKSFEVKWDTRINSTGNLYLELENVNSKGGKGWFEFCKADYLAYGDAVAGKFYIIPLLELKKKVYSKQYRTARCGSDSIGLLVSLADVADISKIL